MTGKHRLNKPQVRHAAPQRAVEVVDARTRTAHSMTMDALAAGRLPRGQYIALCGQDVLPAIENPVRAIQKARAYGYVRVTDEVDDEIRQLESGLRELAEAEGLWLVEIRSEYQAGRYEALYHLLRELTRLANETPMVGRDEEACPAGHLVVPSLAHVSAHPLLRKQLVRRVEEAGVRVWVAEV